MPLRLFTPGPVSSLATSPSGSYLAAAVQESITIWQLGTGPGFKINQDWFCVLQRILFRGTVGSVVPPLPACDCAFIY